MSQRNTGAFVVGAAVAGLLAGLATGCNNKPAQTSTAAGVKPAKKAETTMVATTDANTRGANRLIEKFPSTISPANTAPDMGAL